MDESIIGFVFARGGSKGILRKNLRRLGGKPLIAHAIETGRKSRWIDRMVVSTEDEEIAEVARQYGAETPFRRPAELAQDDSPEWLAWRHAVEAVNCSMARPLEVFVSIRATSPLRTTADVDRCIETFLNSDADLVITVCPGRRSPYFNMVTIDPQTGCAELVIPPAHRIHRRQDAPPVFDITTAVYVARPRHILQSTAMLEGVVKAVVIPPERALDIDTELDFQFAEFLLNQRRQDHSVSLVAS